MEESGITAAGLRGRLDRYAEWLVVRESGAAFPVRASEIELSGDDEPRQRIGFPAERGYRVFGLRSWSARPSSELQIEISGMFGLAAESIELVPRSSAAELWREVASSRLRRARDLARLIAAKFPDLVSERVTVAAAGGRTAELVFKRRGAGTNQTRIGVLVDLTDALSPECLIASALLWADRGARLKNPIGEIWIAAGRRAKAVQKLAALLRHDAAIGVFAVDAHFENKSRLLRPLKLSDIWRGKAKEILLPEKPETSVTAARIVAASPSDIDVVRSRQGETLRFNGLAFARVRRAVEREKAWFGVEKPRRALTEDSRAALDELIAELRLHRRPEPENKRHLHYRLAPEAWLESLLRRNIKALDANLVLSPIYNQFRTASDKIDLLALRRDGRLVIIELKTAPDREMVLQAADYWRKIDVQRRRGVLARARLFGEMKIADRPPLIYAVAPALAFHRDFEFFARRLAPEIELWRFELRADWRCGPQVVARSRYDRGI